MAVGFTGPPRAERTTALAYRVRKISPSARFIEDDCALRSRAIFKRLKLRPNLAASSVWKGKRFCDMTTLAEGVRHGSVPPGESSTSQSCLSKQRGSRI